jgi:hypothetical protein
VLSNHQLVDLVRRGNPVPDDDDLPGPRLTAVELLGRRGSEEPAVTDTKQRTRPNPAITPWWRGPVVAVAVMMVILGVGGVLIALSRVTGTDQVATEPDITPPTTTNEVAPTVVDEATARREGRPYDPAVHDLCAWFSSQEIDAIVTAAYRDHGAEPPPGTFATEGNELGGVGCTWYSEVGGARLFGEDGGAFLAVEFQDADHLVLIPYNSRETGRPDDQPDEFIPYGWDGRVRIGNLSRGVWGYIQGVHASFTVDGHTEVVEFLHWAPHHQNGGPMNPIGLAIADEMLRRIGWVEGKSGADGGLS